MQYTLLHYMLHSSALHAFTKNKKKYIVCFLHEYITLYKKKKITLVSEPQRNLPNPNKDICPDLGQDLSNTRDVMGSMSREELSSPLNRRIGHWICSGSAAAYTREFTQYWEHFLEIDNLPSPWYILWTFFLTRRGRPRWYQTHDKWPMTHDRWWTLWRRCV